MIAKTGAGLVEAMRLLRLARDSAVNARTKAINQLKAVVVGADPQLRKSLAGLAPATLIRSCADLTEPENATAVEQTVIYTAAAGRADSAAQGRGIRAAQATQDTDQPAQPRPAGAVRRRARQRRCTAGRRR
ncbi:hypothetical protein Acsp03_62670 [Actinomadura sp. NBRC 104412]|uniref:hypothetical protein n=1 Tax=Actinomadura sp. NBRC 104412 TaxID=3032203 RepID=UPI0024A00660|nr:hypothetical protein [Actinomadura sp. NBRC 104412]GLZ08801.1 hypothetical protein Acsp03_62670 [Actinomadura sp. NBRC 104412]